MQSVFLSGECLDIIVSYFIQQTGHIVEYLVKVIKVLE